MIESTLPRQKRRWLVSLYAVDTLVYRASVEVEADSEEAAKDAVREKDDHLIDNDLWTWSDCIDREVQVDDVEEITEAEKLT
jgi:hypothetical protein